MLGTVIDLLLFAAAVFLLIPATLLALQVVCSIFPLSRPSQPPNLRPAAAIIVPAHNESATITGTLKSVRAQMRANDRLLVVAHNCTDDTAAIARTLGAEVAECDEPSKIGKGYALDAGLKFITTTGKRNVVVIVDADCVLGPDALDKLVQVCSAEQRPVQGRYLMNVADRADIRQRISAFAWRVKNEVRPWGYSVLGMPCILMGSGTAFPFQLLTRIDLATGHIVEDMRFTALCALLGRPPLYCPEANILSEFAPSATGHEVQKSRWVHGHLSTIGECVPMLIVEAVRCRKLVLLAVAADLAIPPLGLLGAGILGLNALTMLWWLVGNSWAPATLGAIIFLLSLLTLGIAWIRSGRDLISWTELVAIPAYVSKQLTSAGKFFTGRRTSVWIRSERE